MNAQKAMTNLEKKKAVLEKDLAELQAQKLDLRQRYGMAIADGKNSNGLQDELIRMSTREAGLQDAIRLTAEELQAAREAAEQAERERQRNEALAELAALKADLLEALGAVRDIAGQVDGWKATLQRLRTTATALDERGLLQQVSHIQTRFAFDALKSAAGEMMRPIRTDKSTLADVLEEELI